MGTRRRRPRAIFVYLFAIVAPALALLFLALQSVERQREAIRTLSQNNRKLANEKAMAEVERRSVELARQALDQPPSPPFRTAIPIVRHYFVVENGVVTYPRLFTPLPHEPEGLPRPFRDAEELELRERKPREALAVYKAIYESAGSKQVKALTLNRMARCLQALSDPGAAAIWRTLDEQYGDLYDPMHRPYSLTARFALLKLTGIYEDLIQDRWDISAEQFDYYLDKLHREPPPRNRFDLARELGEHFRPVAPLREGEIYSYALPNKDSLYYRAERSGERIFGFSVNAGWVQQSLWPDVRRGLGVGSTVEADSNRGVWIYGGATAAVVAVLLLGIVLILRDVAREAQMNRLRADFVSAASHELKTPITLIRLYAETLLRGHDFSVEERRGFYEILARESERLGQLAQKVLTFSRIEGGKPEYAMQEGDLGASVAETAVVYRQYLERAGYTVETVVPETLTGVRFDPGAVSQAIVNLIENAAKYSGESKFVAVRLRREAREAVVEVEDHGIGIPAGQREKIFERFYRAPNGGVKGGYGIGLFLVRHIMEAHSGRVEVESEPGRGSCFRLIFPVMT